LLGDDLGLIEEVGWEDAGGVEDFDADEAVVAPVECDERVGAGWGAGRWSCRGARPATAGR